MTLPLEAVPWSRRRWAGMVLAGLAAQVVLVLWLGERPRRPEPQAESGTTLHFVTDPNWEERLHATLGFTDPTLLALPGPSGFSGAAWFNFEPLRPEFADWSEPPRWLSLKMDSLGHAFSRYVADTRRIPLLTADVPYEPPFADPNVPVETVPTHSTLDIQGDINPRALLTPPPLPVWTHLYLLSNTVIEVIVNGDGDTVSAIVLRESGSPEADLFARRTAVNARFERVPASGRASRRELDLAAGRMIFNWHTVPAAPPAGIANP